jgi:ribosomal protein S18 acetylase RimI-like enzyme
MTVLIREFSLDDYDAALAIWQSAGPGVGIGRSDTREEIAKKLRRDPDLFLVAEDKGKIVGTVIGGYDGRRGLIYHLAVEQSYRKQGIGKMLMDQVEQRMAEKGCLRSFLLVARGNEDVIDFYNRLGWETMNLTIMVKTLIE